MNRILVFMLILFLVLKPGLSGGGAVFDTDHFQADTFQVMVDNSTPASNQAINDCCKEHDDLSRMSSSSCISDCNLFVHSYSNLFVGSRDIFYILTLPINPVLKKNGLLRPPIA